MEMESWYREGTTVLYTDSRGSVYGYRLESTDRLMMKWPHINKFEQQHTILLLQILYLLQFTGRERNLLLQLLLTGSDLIRQPLFG